MIGIFDSGIGGLSVLKEIYRLLPDERYIYFSDNAHCPYGEKSREYVIGRAVYISELLMKRGADIIVVACNTATAAAITTLRACYSAEDDPAVSEKVMLLTGGRHSHIRFIGMEPAIKPAAMQTRTGVVGVLATSGTLNAVKYKHTRDEYSGRVKVVEHTGEGFVELVERGITEGPEADAVVRRSLKPLLDAGADTIVLGCTHYPFLEKSIAEACEELCPERNVAIINPAPAVARHVLEVLKDEKTNTGCRMTSGIEFLSSGNSGNLELAAKNLKIF